MGNTTLWIIGGLVAVLLLGLIAVWTLSGGPVRYIDRAAQEQFQSGLGRISITVYPTLVRKGYEEGFDLGSAHEIAAFLNERGIATANVAAEEPVIETVWRRNEIRVAAGTARSLAQFVQGQPLETPYALMMECFISPKDGRVMAVHYYVVTKTGSVADAGLINSHHRIFQEIGPHTVEDCTKVAIRHMDDSWTELYKANTGA